MRFLHTMIRINDLHKNLQFFCECLEMVEISRVDNEQGRFTLIFLAAKEDEAEAIKNKAPLIELTYNWPDENGDTEVYAEGSRSFGHIAFQVKNIYSTCERLSNFGITINRPPRDGYMAFIKSPNGISIELLQAGDRLEPMEPWKSMENQGSW